MSNSNFRADAALLATSLIWGSTFVIAKDILTVWPPFVYLAMRFVVAGVLLMWLFRREVLAASRQAWRAGAVLGVLITSGFTLQAIGQIYTTASKSAFITGLTTPLVPFVAFAVLRVRPSLGNLIGVALASAGGWLILAPGTELSGELAVNFGDLLTLSCTLIFALHITMISFYSRRFNARELTVLPVVVAALLCAVAWAVVRGMTIAFNHQALPQFALNEGVALVWTWRVTLQLLYLASVATVLTFLLWTWGQARSSATRAAIIFSLEPVFATLFAVALRGGSEWLGVQGTIGAGLVLLAVLVSELRFNRKRGRGDVDEVPGPVSENPRLTESI